MERPCVSKRIVKALSRPSSTVEVWASKNPSVVARAGLFQVFVLTVGKSRVARHVFHGQRVNFVSRHVLIDDRQSKWNCALPSMTDLSASLAWHRAFGFNAICN